VYIKRGIQGRFKQSSDDIGEQFSPGASLFDYTTNTVVTSSEDTNGVKGPEKGYSGTTTYSVGQPVTTTWSYQHQTRGGSERIGKYKHKNEYWGD
jgi:hypothetical protein